MSVTRLKVVPKFLQEVIERTRPEERKRGLNHTSLEDKKGLRGHISDDEYDIEGACVVGSGIMAEDVKSKHEAMSSVRFRSKSDREFTAHGEGKVRFGAVGSKYKTMEGENRIDS